LRRRMVRTRELGYKLTSKLGFRLLLLYIYEQFPF
jgi:hypothetical protein